MTSSGEEGPSRQGIRTRHGEKGLIDVALVIAACRIFPIKEHVPCAMPNLLGVQVRVQ